MKLQKNLIEWFRRNARPLPWRAHYKPYEVWVSEVMLQQTQVETALPYFKRWMKTFPTITSLAVADEKKVLKAWQGLGYYSRARNLHESAKMIIKKFGGNFPSDFETIRSLKGVGRYSAGAIASIAFNQDRPIVDGNIFRVLSRIFLINKSIDSEKNREIFWRIQEGLIPHGKARYFNQALMELGALVCTKNNPSCPLCPVRTFCKAASKDKAENYPIRSQRKKIEKIEASALVIHCKNKFLIRKRPLGKIMGGLWEFPEWKLSKNKHLDLGEIESQTKKAAFKEFNLNVDQWRYLGKIKRSYTYFNENLHVYTIETVFESLKPRSPWDHAWAGKRDFARTPFSSAHAKILRWL